MGKRANPIVRQFHMEGIVSEFTPKRQKFAGYIGRTSSLPLVRLSEAVQSFEGRILQLNDPNRQRIPYIIPDDVAMSSADKSIPANAIMGLVQARAREDETYKGMLGRSNVSVSDIGYSVLERTVSADESIDVRIDAIVQLGSIGAEITTLRKDFGFATTDSDDLHVRIATLRGSADVMLHPDTEQQLRSELGSLHSNVEVLRLMSL